MKYSIAGSMGLVADSLEMLADSIAHGLSLLALAGNASCLYLLQRSKGKEAYMQASMIFTSMDVIVNIGVIVAGHSCILPDRTYPT